jgi:hypothetical protein
VRGTCVKSHPLVSNHQTIKITAHTRSEEVPAVLEKVFVERVFYPARQSPVEKKGILVEVVASHKLLDRGALESQSLLDLLSIISEKV